MKKKTTAVSKGMDFHYGELYHAYVEGGIRIQVRLFLQQCDILYVLVHNNCGKNKA